MNTKECVVCNTKFIPKVKNQICCCTKCSKYRIKQKSAKRHREWYLKNKDYVINKVDKWRKNNQEYKKAYDKKRYHSKLKNNPHYKCVSALRKYLKRMINNKEYKTFEILGYTKEKFIKHIESLFTDDMTWENYNIVWVIDHIRPVASYIITENNKYEIIKECNKLDNLQPMYKSENIKKGSWYLGYKWQKGYPIEDKEHIIPKDKQKELRLSILKD